MTVPKMSLLVSIRRRLEFTANILPTAMLNASRQHEILLVLDECPLEYEIRRRSESYPEPHDDVLRADRLDRERVYRWIDEHQALLDANGVRVLEYYGDESIWTGGLRSAGALNLGIEKSTTDWMVGIGDEDLVMMPRWDEILWRALGDQDPMRTVSTFTMIMPAVRESWPEPLTSEWIEAQRKLCSHMLALPILPKHAPPTDARIGMETIRRFCEIASKPEMHVEACGVRNKCHWVPMLMHRDLLRQAGGWPIDDGHALSYDIGLDDALAALGVSKRMPLDGFVLHSKHHAFISDEIDRVWGEAEWLRLLEGKDIL